MTLEYRIKHRYGNDVRTVQINNTEALTPEAELGRQLVERWGMIAGKPAGEDAAGRQKGDLMSPAEVVGRALDTAEAFYAEVRKRDLTVTLPTFAEMDAAPVKDD